jgi:hypothetical protein
MASCKKGMMETILSAVENAIEVEYVTKYCTL